VSSAVVIDPHQALVGEGILRRRFPNYETTYRFRSRARLGSNGVVRMEGNGVARIQHEWRRDQGNEHGGVPVRLVAHYARGTIDSEADGARGGWNERYDLMGLRVLVQ